MLKKQCNCKFLTHYDKVNQILIDIAVIHDSKVIINCQSLQAKFSKIKTSVDTFADYNTLIQVLWLQNTLFENSDLIDLGIYLIENYHFVRQNRCANAHDGLAFYILHNLNYKVKSFEIDSPC